MYFLGGQHKLAAALLNADAITPKLVVLGL